MSTPTEITVSGTILDSDGPVAGRLVFASRTLVRDGASNDVLLPQEIVVNVGDTGEFSVDIPATDDPAFSPIGWTWEVRAHFPHWRTAFAVAIPYDSPGGAIAFSNLVPVPPDEDAELYALASHTHEGGGGGGDGPAASSTVVSETTYGASASAGNATTYSRGNHTHGTPALPTPAAIGASPTGHTHAISDTTGLQTALDGKAATSHDHAISDVTSLQTTLDGKAASDHTHPGGSGQTPTITRGRVTSGDVTLGTEAAWTIVPGLEFAAEAVAGDNLTFTIGALIQQSTGDFFELVMIKEGSIIQFASTGTSSSSASAEGDGAIYPQTGVAFVSRSPWYSVTVGSDDLSGGEVTFGIAHKGGGSAAKVFASANFPLRWMIRNDHQ